MNQKTLQEELERWEQQGLIQNDQKERILSLYEPKKSNFLAQFFTALGIFLLMCGFLALISYNWQNIPKTVQLLISLSVVIIFQIGLFFAKTKMLKECLSIALIIALFGAFAFIAQNYQISGKFYQLLFWHIVMIAPLIYLTKTLSSSIFTLFELSILAFLNLSTAYAIATMSLSIFILFLHLNSIKEYLRTSTSIFSSQFIIGFLTLICCTCTLILLCKTLNSSILTTLMIPFFLLSFSLRFEHILFQKALLLAICLTLLCFLSQSDLALISYNYYLMAIALFWIVFNIKKLDACLISLLCIYLLSVNSQIANAFIFGLIFILLLFIYRSNIVLFFITNTLFLLFILIQLYSSNLQILYKAGAFFICGILFIVNSKFLRKS